MNRKIIAGIMIISLILSGTIIAYAIDKEIPDENISPASIVLKEEPEEMIKEFKIERIYTFEEDVTNLTLDQILIKIKDCKEIQIAAHNLAEHARSLEWPEDCQTIINAKNEWFNAQQAILFYQRELEKKKQLNFEQKRSEFPIAAEIWIYMKNLGWNDYVCAGILGNIMAEVGGQTLNIQPYLKGNGYYGMCQWNKAYSSIWGGTLEQQCDYLRDTIKKEFDVFGYAYQDGFNYNSFLSLQDAKQAAKAFAKCYERCGSGSYTIRKDNAQIAYNYFVN